MSFSDELRTMRHRCFISQEAFAKELGVSFSTVNRWESGKTIPNFSAMKSIKEFCSSHNAEFAIIESEWLNSGR